MLVMHGALGGKGAATAPLPPVLDWEEVCRPGQKGDAHHGANPGTGAQAPGTPLLALGTLALCPAAPAPAPPPSRRVGPSERSAPTHQPSLLLILICSEPDL